MGAALATVDRVATARPLAFAVGFAGMKNVTADLIIQTQLEGRRVLTTPGDDDSAVNWTRTAVFGLFGLAYVGGAQFYLFNKVLPSARMIGPALLRGERSAAAKAVAFDQGLHMPFMYFPTFYTLWVITSTIMVTFHTQFLR